MDDPATEKATTTSSERERTTATDLEAGTESTPLQAASVAKPERVSVPVPTTRCLRMFLGVLKHNPVGVIREVGVLLMLLVSSIEVAIGACAATDKTPSVPPSSDEHDSSGRGGRGLQPRPKQRREDAHLARRSKEAAEVLALALAAEKRMVSGWVAGGVAAPRLTKKNKTRFPHQLRQFAKVEDRLQAWAATRGREVSGLKGVLILSSGAELGARSVGAQLVRDRVACVPVRQVEKVR